MSDCESNYSEQEIIEIVDPIDILLEREQSSIEKVLSSLISFKAIIRSQIIISLMKDDIKELEYNRSYNYYYVNKDDDIDEEEYESQKNENYDYYVNLFQLYIQNIVEITKKLSKNKDNDNVILCIAESIDYVIKNMLDISYDYIKSGRNNCLHQSSENVYKTLHYFSNIDKANNFVNLYNQSKVKEFSYIVYKL